MSKYVLYRRRCILRDRGVCLQIDKGRRVFELSDYGEQIDLEGFARRVAFASRSPDSRRIMLLDELTTIAVPVLIPSNGYIDEPVSSDELIRFWRVYSEKVSKG